MIFFSVLNDCHISVLKKPLKLKRGASPRLFFLQVIVIQMVSSYVVSLASFILRVLSSCSLMN